MLTGAEYRWWAVGALQGGGGLFAQRLVTRKHYDMDRAKQLARRSAGLSDERLD